MPEIFDYEIGKTSINEVQVQELFEKWESVSKKLEEMETDGVYRYLDGTDMFSVSHRNSHYRIKCKAYYHFKDTLSKAH